MPPKVPTDRGSDEQSIKSRQSLLYVATADVEAGPRPFAVLLKETPSAPFSMTTKLALGGVSLLVVSLLVASLTVGPAPRTHVRPPRPDSWVDRSSTTVGDSPVVAPADPVAVASQAPTPAAIPPSTPTAKAPAVVPAPAATALATPTPRTGGSARAVVDPPGKLQGVIMGTDGSLNDSGNTKFKAFDGNVDTYFEPPDGTWGWVGLDLGIARKITRVGFAPYKGQGHLMDGATFEGANRDDFSDVIFLYGVNAAPAGGQMSYQDLLPHKPVRYVRYRSAKGGRSNIAEVEFFGQ